ncbi:MarR family transcriptional regulator [Haladaptatus sp. YSMS36]|uniref:helix-turn-helix transcriptional regulator n=1 Tax=Haladaptatus sp. YSMS36 TaxID=3033384 RepID=UPI0023E82705|nr:MarR family transcriptional regulator [Haladaptatus sp. YSMS36]
MTTDTLDDSKLDEASNVLVLAPLTPTGNGAFRELVTAMSTTSETNLAAITYTQPPESWLEDWQTHIGSLPASLSFIHANGAAVTHEPETVPPHLEATSILKVNPREPMDIIAPLTKCLIQWQTTDRQSVVSVQTLSILLEYVDFDTAFRYLHVLTHRVKLYATGFYQMDPDLHDAKTVYTLKTLFDAVVELDADGWHVTKTYTSQPEDDSTAETDGLLSAISGVIDRLSAFGGGRETPETPATPPEPTPQASASSEFTSDADRICELLSTYGGRMKQADVISETSWSKATVSRKLSKMELDGIISRVRVGRENVVFLAGYEPAPVETVR